MKFLLSQIKILFTNWIGLSSVFVNFVLAVWGVFEKGGYYNIFHWYYEPIQIKILFCLNLPSILIAEFFNEVIFAPAAQNRTSVSVSNSEMLLIVIFSIFQWLVFGYICKLIFREKLR